MDPHENRSTLCHGQLPTTIEHEDLIIGEDLPLFYINIFPASVHKLNVLLPPSTLLKDSIPFFATATHHCCLAQQALYIQLLQHLDSFQNHLFIYRQLGLCSIASKGPSN
jgi:hypothetical protein